MLTTTANFWNFYKFGWECVLYVLFLKPTPQDANLLRIGP